MALKSDTDTNIAATQLCTRCGRSSAVGASLCSFCGAALADSKTLCVEPTLLQVDTGMPPRLMPDPPGPPAVDPLIGRDLERYRIDAFLGRGGMGKVYLAHHRDLHRPCALKLLLPELVKDDEDYVQRFLNEGRHAASLVHPNIVTIHACGQAEGFYFLEMEFVAGRSMRQLIHDEVRLSPLRATALTAKVADALAVAHKEHIVHQDLKPDNVLMTLQGAPKLADFGLAKRLKNVSQESKYTLCGTPNYMAPELFHGEHANEASDVYALGVTYFVALTGRFPFHAETLRGLMDSVMGEPVPELRKFVADVSLDIAECISRFLDKTPANRPQNAVEASLLLHAILGDVRDLDSLIDEAFRDHLAVQAFSERPRYRLTVTLCDGRRQTVFVEPSDHSVAERLLVITSVCCEARPSFYEQALRINGEMPHGSVAVRDVDGQPMFVVVDTYPRATVDAEEIRKSVLSVASRADAIEHVLTGGLDHH